PLPEVSGAVQAKPGASGSDARAIAVCNATRWVLSSLPGPCSRLTTSFLTDLLSIENVSGTVTRSAKAWVRNARRSVASAHLASSIDGLSGTVSVRLQQHKQRVSSS